MNDAIRREIINVMKKEMKIKNKKNLHHLEK